MNLDVFLQHNDANLTALRTAQEGGKNNLLFTFSYLEENDD